MTHSNDDTLLLPKVPALNGLDLWLDQRNIRLTTESNDKLKDSIKKDQDNVCVEVTMVGFPNAVVNPRAVMIVPRHTSVTNVAMSALGLPDHFTERAERLRFELFQQCHELY